MSPTIRNDNIYFLQLVPMEGNHIDEYVKDKCGRWKGGYLTPEYQIVTDEDTSGLMKALQRPNAPLDLLLFLSYGAFRIAG